MSEASPRLMLIDADHLRIATEQNIHLVRWPNEPARVEQDVRRAATALDYHVVLLDGRKLRTEREALSAVAEAFQFPESARETLLASWCATGKFPDDPARLFARSSSRKGVVIFLREPEPFMRTDFLEFGLFFQVLATCSKAFLENEIPSSVVVAPLPEEHIYEYALSCFTVATRFCETCWRLDPLVALDPEYYL